MSFSLYGIERTLSQLKAVGSEGRKAIRQAQAKSNRYVKKTLKAAVPVDEGVLKKMIDDKVISRNIDSVKGIVGASVKKLKEGIKHRGNNEKRPSNVDWLVEFGHVAPNGKFIPPSGAYRATASATRTAANQIFANELKQGLGKLRA